MKIRRWKIFIAECLAFALPFGLTALVYRAQRPFVKGLIGWAGGVHVREPYAFDQTWFGIVDGARTWTPNEWLQTRTHPALDFVSGVFYLAFIPLYFAFAAYARWVWGRKKSQGTPLAKPAQVRALSTRLLWGFFFVNVLGYATYYLYPAAPPWYAAIYGFGPADLTVKPFAAGALRFDELLNVQVFREMYSHGESVFGAIPSLHNAYPMLVLMFALRLGAGRLFAGVYVAGMALSALYLDHHYVLDVLWGWAYALIVAGALLLTEKQSSGASES